MNKITMNNGLVYTVTNMKYTILLEIKKILLEYY